MKNIIYIFLVIFFSCSFQEEVGVNKAVKPKSGKNSSFLDKYPNNFEKLYEDKKDWFLSFDSIIHADSFQIIFENSFEVNWEEYEKKYAPEQIHKNLMSSHDSIIFVDIYSYNTSFTLTGDSIIVDFEVDTRVKLYNLEKKQSAEVLFTGSDMYLEDSYWSGENIFYVLGYSLETNKPQIYVFDMAEKNYYCFQYIANEVELDRERYILNLVKNSYLSS